MLRFTQGYLNSIFNVLRQVLVFLEASIKICLLSIICLTRYSGWISTRTLFLFIIIWLFGSNPILFLLLLTWIRGSWSINLEYNLFLSIFPLRGLWSFIWFFYTQIICESINFLFGFSTLCSFTGLSPLPPYSSLLACCIWIILIN